MTLKQLKKRLDPVAQRFGYYTAYRLGQTEYVGDHHLSVNSVVNHLESNGYETPPTVAGVTLSAAKLHPMKGGVHEATLRKVDSDNPRWQWHVHLWTHKPHTEIFSHYEMRPDFKKIAGEDTAEMIGRLKIHYRPEYGEDYYRGKTDSVVKDLVND